MYNSHILSNVNTLNIIYFTRVVFYLKIKIGRIANILNPQKKKVCYLILILYNIILKQIVTIGF